jgi:23S rRNA (uracil1939-C5)-methyltransferase
MAEIHAVEGGADMLAALDKAWRKTQGLKKISHEKRDLFRRPLLPDELNKFEAAVIDPPRAGAEAQVTMLAKSTIKTLAYVSCNPVSFARDAKILTDAGYSLGAVTPVDQFRWSYHVELVGAFHKPAA